MGRRTVTQFANQIKRVLSPAVINDLGRDAGFCVRERLITPYRLVVSLLAGHAMGRVETLADIQRQFNALFATTVAYKPFHNQLAKRTFPDFMREVLSSHADGGYGIGTRASAFAQGVARRLAPGRPWLL